MKSLKELHTNLDDEKRILEGSCMFGCTLETWTAQRQFITEAIDRSGTILDIGCANGLLLRSLIEWSKHDLTPYGVDPSQERLAGVKGILPKFENNFAALAITELEQLSSLSLPSQFDIVYWNIWDNFDFIKQQTYVTRAFSAVKPNGRLILGFYHANSSANEEKIVWFKEHYPTIAGRKDNLPHVQMMIWYDL